MEKQIFVSYNKDYDGRSVEGYVISMFCGNTSHGGLVDRLRGAISVYAVCKEIGRDFKINFVHPFSLLDFLVPNKYDWTVASNEISFHKDSSEIIVLDTAVNSSLERRRQKKYLVRRLANRHLNTQTHVYTNAALCYDCNFRQLFNDLFRPSESLQKHLDEIKSQIGGRYISVSARFLNLMGDFNEENYSEPLPFDEQEKLLSECIIG